MASKTEGLGLHLYGPKDYIDITGLSRNFSLLEAAAIQSYRHTKEGVVHQLTGVGEYLVFTPTADYGVGESFLVNGTAVAAITLDGHPLPGGCFATGSRVLAVLQQGRLVFQFRGKLSAAGNGLTWDELRTL